MNQVIIFSTLTFFTLTFFNLSIYNLTFKSKYFLYWSLSYLMYSLLVANTLLEHVNPQLSLILSTILSLYTMYYQILMTLELNQSKYSIKNITIVTLLLTPIYAVFIGYISPFYIGNFIDTTIYIFVNIFTIYYLLSGIKNRFLSYKDNVVIKIILSLVVFFIIENTIWLIWESLVLSNKLSHYFSIINNFEFLIIAVVITRLIINMLFLMFSARISYLRHASLFNKNIVSQQTQKVLNIVTNEISLLKSKMEDSRLLLNYIDQLKDKNNSLIPILTKMNEACSDINDIIYNITSLTDKNLEIVQDIPVKDIKKILKTLQTDSSCSFRLKYSRKYLRFSYFNLFILFASLIDIINNESLNNEEIEIEIATRSEPTGNEHIFTTRYNVRDSIVSDPITNFSIKNIQILDPCPNKLITSRLWLYHFIVDSTNGNIETNLNLLEKSRAIKIKLKEEALGIKV